MGVYYPFGVYLDWRVFAAARSEGTDSNHQCTSVSFVGLLWQSRPQLVRLQVSQSFPFCVQYPLSYRFVVVLESIMSFSFVVVM